MRPMTRAERRLVERKRDLHASQALRFKALAHGAEDPVEREETFASAYEHALVAARLGSLLRHAP